MRQILPDPALNFMQEMKKSLDPNNIFAINNTIYRLPNEEKEDLEGHH
jgi:ABC-type iron transport system FetAB ATPase subunit